MLIRFLFVVIFIFSFKSFAQPELSDYSAVVETSGDILELILPASALTATLLKKDWKGSKQFALSFGTSFAVTRILKYAIDKPRPNNPWNFKSFPSGHTASSFVGASFIQRRYGWEYGKFAYVLAAFVGYSRIESQNHDFWDVLAGAAIGVGSTYIFTKPYNNTNISVGFSSHNGYRLVSLQMQF
jgi:membrane-associated phospholipid phosphatase